MKHLYRGKKKKDGRWALGSLYTGNMDNKIYHAIINGAPTVTDSELPEGTAFAASDKEFHPIESETAGQFLMLDILRKPMFENDIVKQTYDVIGEDGTVVRSGYHIGVAKLTTEGAQLANLRHYNEDGTPIEPQPHKNKRIQIRKRRSRVLGNIFDNPELLEQTNI